MSELIARFGAVDKALLEAVVQGDRSHHPHRLVADAVAVPDGRIAAAARHAGLPLLIDPQTHYLQGRQHAADAWAQLPFGDPVAQTSADLLAPGRCAQVAALTIDHQLRHGASAIIAPYVSVERAGGDWSIVQIELWRATRAHLDREGLRLPVLAVLACGWRQLERSTWPGLLTPLIRSLRDDLDPTEVALAASKVDQGTRPADRLAGFLAVVARLRRDWPVIAWQQGALGELAVAAGAAGYESGLGWRESCDHITQMNARRSPSSGGTARPVYVSALGRSIPKRSLEVLLRHPRIGAQLACLDYRCCPGGPRDLLGDARPHALAARRQRLDDLVGMATARWRWSQLAEGAAAGLDLADRINTVAARDEAVSRVQTGALEATLAVADHLRSTASGHAA